MNPNNLKDSRGYRQRRQWHPTPVLLPGKSHGRRSLVGCSPWGRTVGHDWATSLSCIGKGNGNPLRCSCLENPRDGGAWWAAVYGVAQSRTWLKWLSSSRALQNGSPSLSNHLDPSASEQLATFSLRVKLRSQHMTQIDFNPNSMTACQVVEYRCNPFMSVLWVELCPAQNSHVEVPSPRILEYDCIEDRAFKR